MSDLDTLHNEVKEFGAQFGAIREAVGRVIVGQERVVEGVLTAIVAGGNVLLEGVPGLGKTELVKALSKALHLEFSRIQFTPDLMPADILGTTVMSQTPDGGYAITFRRGPVFTQLLLADEINRATPKTQSALLETMQEGTVTVGGETHVLTQPFFVLATQNPLEQEGTYPLPEAQLDRFLFKIDVPFPSRSDLNEVVSRTLLRPVIDLQTVIDGPGLLALRALVDKVAVTDEVRDYAVRLVLATHAEHPESGDRIKRFVRWGASPRAAQALIRAGRVRALVAGRGHLASEDVRHYAPEVLRHRLILNYDGQAEGVRVEDLIDNIVAELPEAGG
ncbi:MAG: MoxR family ATPase [Planctomycetota bacterium]|jgi:MoxR-like ATPase|nr:MoxR family ATPase [Planctomycetota bacterium]